MSLRVVFSTKGSSSACARTLSMEISSAWLSRQMVARVGFVSLRSIWLMMLLATPDCLRQFGERHVVGLAKRWIRTPQLAGDGLGASIQRFRSFAAFDAHQTFRRKNKNVFFIRTWQGK